MRGGSRVKKSGGVGGTNSESVLRVGSSEYKKLCMQANKLHADLEEMYNRAYHREYGPGASKRIENSPDIKWTKNELKKLEDKINSAVGTHR